MPTILAQGAEAILIRKGDTVVKHRVAKGYRLAELDVRLRRLRQRREEKVIATLAAAGVPVPQVLEHDENTMSLTVSFIDGPKVRDVIGKEPARYGAALGTLLAQMHKNGVAHGDPTTSNFIVSSDNADKVVVIDFGLSAFTKKPEDYAVDLHLLRQVLTGTHTAVADTAWHAALKAYATTWPDGTKVIDRLEQKVEKRGRNKKR